MLFDRWRQRVLPQGHIGVTWRIRLNLCILRPTRVHNRNGKWIGLAVLHSLRQKVPILYNGRSYPSELPLPMEDLDIPCDTWCFRPMPAHNPNGTSIGSAVFAQMTAECLYCLQWFTCFPLKIAHSHVGIWTSCNTWFIEPTRVRNANGNLIVSAVFCRAH